MAYSDTSQDRWEGVGMMAIVLQGQNGLDNDCICKQSHHLLSAGPESDWKEDGKMNARLGSQYCHFPRGLTSPWGQGMDSSKKVGVQGRIVQLWVLRGLYTNLYPTPYRP